MMALVFVPAPNNSDFIKKSEKTQIFIDFQAAFRLKCVIDMGYILHINITMAIDYQKPYRLSSFHTYEKKQNGNKKPRVQAARGLFFLVLRLSDVIFPRFVPFWWWFSPCIQRNVTYSHIMGCFLAHGNAFRHVVGCLYLRGVKRR